MLKEHWFPLGNYEVEKARMSPLGETSSCALFFRISFQADRFPSAYFESHGGDQMNRVVFLTDSLKWIGKESKKQKWTLWPPSSQYTALF